MAEGWLQLWMATHHTAELFLQTVQATDVVSVAMGDQNGGDAGLTQFGVKIQYLLRPGAKWLSCIHNYHVVLWISHEVNVGAAWVHGPEAARVFFNVGGEDMFSDLHLRVTAPSSLNALSLTVGMVAASS